MVVAKASNRIAIKAKERTSTEINRKQNGGVVVSLRIVVKGRRPGQRQQVNGSGRSQSLQDRLTIRLC